MDRLSSLFYHLREGVQTGSTVIPSYVWRSMPVSWSMRGLRLLWFTPGVGGTGILFGKDSGCPKWLAALGRRALDCFHDKGAGASLVNVQAVCTEYQPYLYIHPSLFGDTIGKPVISAMPEKFRKGSVRKDADTIIREKITQKKLFERFLKCLDNLDDRKCFGNLIKAYGSFMEILFLLFSSIRLTHR